jgi:hypothetical protein
MRQAESKARHARRTAVGALEWYLGWTAIEIGAKNLSRGTVAEREPLPPLTALAHETFEFLHG